MKIVRAAISIVIVVAALLAIDRFCFVPFRCSYVEYSAEQSTYELAAHEGGASVPQHARDNLRAMRQCMSARPMDVNIYMIAAANARLIGDNATAINYYNEAFRYDRRPELFINLANTQSRIGQRDAAIENFVRAFTFWPGSGEEIEDPIVHDEVMRRIKAYETEIRSRER